MVIMRYELVVLHGALDETTGLQSKAARREVHKDREVHEALPC
jgi:hypothetical protein